MMYVCGFIIIPSTSSPPVSITSLIDRSFHCTTTRKMNAKAASSQAQIAAWASFSLSAPLRHYLFK